jgi:glycosyltransferase involved in cell wall biosynthesis
VVSVEVILPCLNEAAALPWVLSRMPPGIDPIVVDNGSTDGSPELAARLGARVVTATVRGYGAACDAGLRAATAEVVAVMDCDGSLDPEELPRVLVPLLGGSADLVVGARRASGAYAFPWPLRVANWVLARKLTRRTSILITDCGPMRAARRELLVALALTDRRSGYPAQTVVRAADAGARVVQVEVGYRPRRGRSKVTGTPLGVWRAVRDSSLALTR